MMNPLITQLITPGEVLDLAFTEDDTVDISQVRRIRIEIAQLRYIRPAFGDAMYQKMRIGTYDEFIEYYIKPALAHYVRYEMIGELAVRVGEYGIVRPSSEHSEQTSLDTKNDEQKRIDNSEQTVINYELREKESSDTNHQNNSNTSKSLDTTNEGEYSLSTDINNIEEAKIGNVIFQSMMAEEDDVVTSIIINEFDSADNSTSSTKSTENVTKEYEVSRNVARSVSAEGSEIISGSGSSTSTDTHEASDATLKSGTESLTLNSENSGVGNTNRTSFTAASTIEWKTLANQAFRDGRVFLRYAVEYVEANEALFPDYSPLSGKGARRRIGGIVL